MKVEPSYSQFGEDTIIAKIFEDIEPRTRWCFEFGAADGRWLSNTLRFRNEGWYSVLAEYDHIKCDILKESFDNEKTTIVCGPVNDIDFTLSITDCPTYFDFMSCDVDGDEYHLWKDMEVYRAMVVCIEFSPYTNAPYYDAVNPAKRGYGQTSKKPMLELGKQKGYKLVDETFCNLIFLDENVG